MATLARSAAEGVPRPSCPTLALQWELAADQWDTLLADLDTWYNRTNGLGDSTTNKLDSIRKNMDDLSETL